METKEGATRARGGCKGKQWLVLPMVKQRNGLQTAYMVTSASLQRMQPSELGLPKSGG